MSREELEQAIALLYRRFREPTVPETDLTKMISLTLNWAKPSQAPHLLARAVQAGLLKRREDGFEITFDPAEVDLPFGFKPSDGLFVETEMPAAEPAAEASAPPASEADDDAGPSEEEHPGQATAAAAAGESTGEEDGPLLEELLDLLAERDGDRKAAVAAVNNKQDALGGKVSMEAAALIVAAEAGLAVQDPALRVLDELGVEPSETARRA